MESIQRQKREKARLEEDINRKEEALRQAEVTEEGDRKRERRNDRRRERGLDRSFSRPMIYFPNVVRFGFAA